MRGLVSEVASRGGDVDKTRVVPLVAPVLLVLPRCSCSKEPGGPCQLTAAGHIALCVALDLPPKFDGVLDVSSLEERLLNLALIVGYSTHGRDYHSVLDELIGIGRRASSCHHESEACPLNLCMCGILDIRTDETYVDHSLLGVSTLSWLLRSLT